VVFHDRELARITNDSGLLAERTLAELKQLDAGSSYSELFAGEKIPTLEETIRLLSPSRIGLLVELKIDPGREDHRVELVSRTLELLKRTRFQKRAILASFDRETICQAKTFSPEVETGLIFNQVPVWEESAEEDYSGIDFLSAAWNIITRDRVAAVHRSGKKVIAWTIDREEDLKQVLPLSVDAVASNNPQWLIDYLNGAITYKPNLKSFFPLPGSEENLAP
jgi:glycerophosphoryl diester phosphodiesterase